MKFSQRHGTTPVPVALVRDVIPDELRNSLWNVFDREVWQQPSFVTTYSGGYSRKGEIGPLTDRLWENHFKLPSDTLPNSGPEILALIRSRFFNAQWFELYDLVEAVIQELPRRRVELERAINGVLSRELAAYRLVQGRFAEVTSEQELATLNEALAGDQFSPVSAHIRSALVKLSSRTDPDYRNSMKESISAVEAMARIATGKSTATLGDALRVLETKHSLNAQFKLGLEKLYAYTNGPDGIRHALGEGADLTVTDAKFFLLICSSFVNYLKAKL